MAKLKINSKDTIEGKLTVNRTLVESAEGSKIVVEGALKTKEYIEEILSIDSPRFSIDGINVIQESFGSEEPEILYSFTAESLTVGD
ncbi:hypothetical protein P8918_13655 [Bacillus spizizenii]|nr:hypothetical protein [Bacillus spizizenii]MCY8890350.1 hypothetical protein [Bacillus spizizenii]MEC0842074.1 hypothetical protein [Bacillus spizizenii]